MTERLSRNRGESEERGHERQDDSVNQRSVREWVSECPNEMENEEETGKKEEAILRMYYILYVGHLSTTVIDFCTSCLACSV